MAKEKKTNSPNNRDQDRFFIYPFFAGLIFFWVVLVVLEVVFCLLAFSFNKEYDVFLDLEFLVSIPFLVLRVVLTFVSTELIGAQTRAAMLKIFKPVFVIAVACTCLNLFYYSLDMVLSFMLIEELFLIYNVAVVLYGGWFIRKLLVRK